MSDSIDPSVAPVVTPLAAPAVDPNAIAAAVAAGMAAHSQALESRPAPMTEEQRREYLQVFELDDNFVDGYHNALTDPDTTPAQRRDILERYRDGVVNQSLRGAELFIDQRIQSLRDEFQPALAAQVKNQGEAIWNDFTTKHADLPMRCCSTSGRKTRCDVNTSEGCKSDNGS